MAQHKVIILGAGPAGLSCALWLHNSGFAPVALERADQCGGMLCFNHHDNDWLLGFPGATGLSILQQFMAHLSQHDFPVITSAALTGLRQDGDGFVVAYAARGRTQEQDLRKQGCASGSVTGQNVLPEPFCVSREEDKVSQAGEVVRAAADFLVIASGMRPRAPLELTALAAQAPQSCLIGAGELRLDAFAPGQRVAILGGGDNAFENAHHLARRGVKVDLYYRGQPRARREWRDRCAALSPDITLHPQTVTAEFAARGNGEKGKEGATGVVFRANGAPRYADALAVMYGYQPNTDTLARLAPWLGAALDGEGFVQVDEYQRTGIARLYAIGDVTNRPLPCLPSAIGQGSVAAKAIVLESEGRLP